MALREKKPCLVVTFAETTMAMKMETKAKEAFIPGRLIPLPREISAGCGLSWKTEPCEEENLLRFMEQQGIIYDGLHQLSI